MDAAARSLFWLALCMFTTIIAGKDFVVVSKSSNMNGAYKCDGKQDDVEIQKAIDQAAKSGGGTITLSEGVFVIEKQIWLDSKITLQGQGMGKTTVKLADNAPKWKNAGQVRAQVGAKNIAVKKLTIDGNRQNQKNSVNSYGKYGFYCSKCVGVVLDQVQIQSCLFYGFDPHGEAKTNNAGKDLRITNCVAEDNGWDGLTIDKNDGIYLYNNTIRNNLRYGLNICCGCTNVIAENNHIENNGLSVKGNGQVDYTNVIVQSNVLHGKMYATKNVVLQNNQISGTKGWGMVARDVDKVEFTSNTINAGSGLCILYRDSDQGTLSSNQCSKAIIAVDGQYDKGTFNVEKQPGVKFFPPKTYGFGGVGASGK